MLGCDELEQAVINCAIGVAQRAVADNSSDKTWTENLISTLAKLGQGRNYYVCGHRCHEYGGQGEWLYDLVWLENHDGFIVDVPLILESEWRVDSKGILEDFEKLLVGRAQHRVMIFQQKSDVKRISDRCIEQVRRFGQTRAGDRYLFLGFEYTQKVFQPEVFVA